MFATAARRMGYRVAVWDPDPDAPAHQLAAHSYTTPFPDTTSRERFASLAHAVTLEWENVPAELCGWLEERSRMTPSSAVLRTLQDRIEQKQFLSSRLLSVPSFAAVESASQLKLAVDHLGLPLSVKRRRVVTTEKGSGSFEAPPM